MSVFGLDTTNLQKYIDSYGRYLVRQAKKILKKRGDTGKLEKSLTYIVDVSKKGFSISLISAKHGEYISKGVSGTKTKRTYITKEGKRKRSPFKYKASSNLRGLEAATETFRKYAKRKGLKGRGKDGRFITDKQLGFMIAESVKKKGIKAASYYTKPLSMSFSVFKKKLGENFAKDIINEIREI